MPEGIGIGMMVMVSGYFIAACVMFFFFNYWSQARAIIGPYMRVKASKGKKILLMIDTGTGKYHLVDAEREALGYTAKDYGNFEAYEEGIKPFGPQSVPMGLAHAELEVMIPPATAVWLQTHGHEVSRENIDMLPDAFQYLFCKNQIKDNGEEKTCGWMGPLMPMDNGRPSKVKELWITIMDATRNEKNLYLPKPLPETEEPTCPECKSELTTVKTDRSFSQIPNQPIIYNLSKVRDWVDEVASPLNMDMAIEMTRINTMKKMSDAFTKLLPYLVILVPVIISLAILWSVANQGGMGLGDSVKGASSSIDL